MKNQRILYAVIVVLAVAVVGLGIKNYRMNNRGQADLHKVMEKSGMTVDKTPTPEPAVDNQNQSQATDGTTVYITRTGKRYHREGCSSLSRSKIVITLSDAKARGYTPCQRCSPPE